MKPENDVHLSLHSLGSDEFGDPGTDLGQWISQILTSVILLECQGALDLQYPAV